MPTLDWIGKDKVVNHHLDVPYHVLDKKYTVGAEESENMIIHGDNLTALKSLLPKYEGKIDCIYIDPPYNTGNSIDKGGWAYSDNVDDPVMKKWLGETVGNEMDDLSRHDKWLCMMYPRLRLLKKLLAKDGLIFISIDDNEVEHLRNLCNEIFGHSHFINQFVWQRNSSAKTEKGKFTVNTEYVLLYSNSSEYVLNDTFKPLSEATRAMYSKDDNDGRGPYRLYPLQKPASPGPETTYDYVDNNGKVWPCPPKGWRMKQSKLKELENDGRLCLDNKSLSEKAYWNERDSEGKRIDTLWNDLPQNTAGSAEIEAIFGAAIFNNPKPTGLIQRCLEISKKDAIILDSFAGSGTTAHAVLRQNQKDNGTRKFILVELGDYAETITAERVKKVIRGYGQGKQKVDGIEGSFSFYELGDAIIKNDSLNFNIPEDDIKEFVYYLETKEKYSKKVSENALLGVNAGCAYYFFYEKGKVITLNRRKLSSIKTKAESYVIYADQCTLSDEELKKFNITFKKISDIGKI